MAEDQPSPGTPDDTEWGTGGGEGRAGVQDTAGLSERVHRIKPHITTQLQNIDLRRILPIYYIFGAARRIILAAIFMYEVISMIEKLMNPERLYGEPAYSKFSGQIGQLQQTLSEHLTQQGRVQLEKLADTYIRREAAALSDAFADGFWTGLELILEFCQRNRT